MFKSSVDRTNEQLVELMKAMAPVLEARASGKAASAERLESMAKVLAALRIEPNLLSSVEISWVTIGDELCPVLKMKLTDGKPVELVQTSTD